MTKVFPRIYFVLSWFDDISQKMSDPTKSLFYVIGVGFKLQHSVVLTLMLIMKFHEQHFSAKIIHISAKANSQHIPFSNSLDLMKLFLMQNA